MCQGEKPPAPPVAPPAPTPAPGAPAIPTPAPQSAGGPVSLFNRWLGRTSRPNTAPLPATPFSTPEQSRGRMQEVVYYRDALGTALLQPGTQWILGGGYSQLWNLVNAAEEALFAVAPLQNVVGEAIYDEMRLNDAKIGNSEEWMNKLRRAVEDLDPNALYYLKPAAVQGPASGGAVPPAPIPPPAPPTPVTDQEKKLTEKQQAQARVILRAVRKMINDFSTEKWDGLISARNQLLGTMIFVGLAVYIFVGFAIFLQINPQHLVVAAILALIGALAGLVGRWRDELQTDSALDDYRLSTARLVVTPLLAGVAAVIGVLAVAKATSLNDIYQFGTLPSNLIIAVVFGLTPNLLIDQLRKKADGYKADLQSMQPTSGK